MGTGFTRREFARTAGSVVSAAAAILGSGPSMAQAKLTAADVVDRIKKKLAAEGVVWGPSAFDGFHLGDPQIKVTGVAATFEPTLDVLKRALAVKKNFVISHE